MPSKEDIFNKIKEIIAQGAAALLDTRVYEGEQRDGKPHGQGILKNTGGTVVYDGAFENVL